MSTEITKTREEILAERQEKKKKKAALKNQSGKKNASSAQEKVDSKAIKENKSEGNLSSVSKTAPTLSSKSKDELSKIPDSLAGNLEHSQDNKSVNKKLESTHKVKESDLMVNDQKKGKENSTVGVEKDKINNLDIGSESKPDKAEDLSNADKGVTKSKAQLRAERRAKQEADRARKLNALPQEKKVAASPAKETQPAKVVKITTAPSEQCHKVKLFAHLYNAVPDTDTVDSPIKVHSSIIQLGAQYASRVVSGANARCLALLNALKKVVMDFETPQNQEFSRGLEAEITKSMVYLSKCRPVAVSMVNAVKHLKFQISQIKGNELEGKNIINDWIDVYIKEQLEMAAKAICLFVHEKISEGDVILTYGCSSLIQQILISVHNEGINFQVIVVDGRPWLEGKEMLRKLVSAGISCTYVFVNGLSFVMPEVTKILLGAHALLTNGYVMSRAGSSQIALLAKAYNVPVLVCCETNKFSERVQTDSFVYNELGNPDDLVSNKGCMSKELSKWKSIPYLTPLNLTYDVTPSDLVSAVVTEIAVLPCTSVPVILRIKPPDIFC